ncbi:PatB family C-S lyase [Sulfurimonas sp. HSL1-2]|uniref:PatB family C-S lyase n=1 Tax=Thiomicrolovo zhangzhouensis TaxID=3131933 RepID=UPI0031F942F1
MSIFDRVTVRSGGNAEKYALRQKLFGTEDVLPMWVADMDIETPLCVRTAVMKRAEHPVYGYEEMPRSAFEAQCTWMATRHGVTMAPEELFFSHSVVASISAAIAAFTDPGDEVVVQPPIYPPFVSTVRHRGRRVLSNPLRQDEEGIYRFDLEGLEQQITPKTKLLLLCSPHNPVGRVWECTELEALAEICLRHGITVFADEIHSDLVFAGHKHTPFVSLGEAVRRITVTAIGPGKTFNVAGLAVSTVAITDTALRERFKAVYDTIHFAQGTVFGHAGFEAAYREGAAWLEALLGHLQGNIDRLADLTARFETIAFRPPEGTYLAWLDCRRMGFESDKALREFFIREARLGLSPGISFGREGSGFMRLNFAVPTPTMDEALYRLEGALQRL